MSRVSGRVAGTPCAAAGCSLTGDKSTATVRPDMHMPHAIFGLLLLSHPAL